MELREAFPAPRIKVSNRLGAIPNIEIRAIVTDLLTQDDATKPNCDYMSRSKIAGTLEYFRMEDVCRITITGDLQTTNEEGYAVYSNLKIKSGPQVLTI